MKTKARSCEFGALKDSLIRDRIVCGIHSDKTRSRLLREAELTLERTVDICRANEATATQMKKLGENSAINHSTNLMEMDTIDASGRGEVKKFYCDKHSDIATSIRLQKHTDILTVYKEYGMIMEEPLVNETDIS